jgi:hypothetical protein
MNCFEKIHIIIFILPKSMQHVRSWEFLYAASFESIQPIHFSILCNNENNMSQMLAETKVDPTVVGDS